MAEGNKNNEEPRVGRKTTRIERLKEKFKGTVKFSFIFFSAIHIAQIVIAAVFYKSCPVEPDIPIYLLILGILGLVTKFLTLFKDFIIKYIKITPILSFVTTAELAIFIVGSYYVYREYKPDYDFRSGDTYCNKTLYLFFFIYLTIVYCLILLCIFLVGCFLLALVLLDKYGSEEKEYDVETTTEVPLTTELEPKGTQ